MKNNFLFLLIIISLTFGIKKTYSQSVPGEDCINAAPFCTDIVYDFPLGTNTISEPGPNYGCLYTFPNPVWYYLKIATPGNITIKIEGRDGGIGRDVDFICWGPFSSMGSICTDSLFGACSHAGSGGGNPCPNNTSNPSFYPTYSAPNIIDCSYDAAPIENCHINNAQRGKYYLLCITNFSNRPGMLKFSKVAGTATTDCSIVYNKAGFDYWHACEGELTNFSDTSNFLSPITSRLWDFGDGQSDTAQNPTHVYAAAGKYIVRLSVLSDGDTYFAAKEIIVNKLITSISAVSPNICVGDSLMLNAVITSYPQTYNKVEFKKTVNQTIPNVGLDPTLWNGGLPPEPLLNSLYIADTAYVNGINPGWSINNISLNINHQQDEDIMVYIKAPGGSYVQLIKYCGDNGDNFVRTTFLPPPLATQPIDSAIAPFTGYFIPSGGPGIWTSLTGFVNPNGKWVLSVADAYRNLFEGSLLDWTIEFNNPKLTGVTYKWNAPINDSTSLIQYVRPTDTTTYSITITNEYGCTTNAEYTVNVVPSPNVTICADTTICLGDSATLYGSGASIYTWMPGYLNGSEIKVAPMDTTMYYLSGMNEYGCVSSPKIVYVNVTTGPKINLVRDTTVCVNVPITLTATGANSYLWMPDSIYAQSITVTPLVETDYYVIGTDVRGCSTVDTITVKIDYSNTLFIPNTFSPNGDNQNDILYVRGVSLKEIDFSIYDRLGEKVFYSNDQSKGWDGTYNGSPLSPGVFAYYIVAKTFDDRIIRKKGNITLIK